MKTRLLIAVLLTCLETHAQSWEIGARSGFCLATEEVYLWANGTPASQAQITYEIFVRHTNRNRLAIELRIGNFNIIRTDVYKYSLFGSPNVTTHDLSVSNFIPLTGTISYRISKPKKKLQQYLGISATYLYQWVRVENKTNDPNKTYNGDWIYIQPNIGTPFNSVFTGLTYNVTYKIHNRLNINILISSNISLNYWTASTANADSWGSYSIPTIVNNIKLGLSYTL